MPWISSCENLELGVQLGSVLAEEAVRITIEKHSVTWKLFEKIIFAKKYHYNLSNELPGNIIKLLGSNTFFGRNLERSVPGYSMDMAPHCASLFTSTIW